MSFNHPALGPIIFVVVVIGGMGSLGGAFLASLLLGIIQTFAIAMDHSLASGLQRLSSGTTGLQRLPGAVQQYTVGVTKSKNANQPAKKKRRSWRCARWCWFSSWSASFNFGIS